MTQYNRRPPLRGRINEEKRTMYKKHLEAWYEADLAVASGEEYQMGSRRLKMPDVPYIKAQIAYWEKRLSALENTGCGSRRHFHVVPCDL